MNKLMYIMMMLMLAIPVTAMNPALMVTTTSMVVDEPEQQRASGCVPPIDFSVQHNCHLRYYTSDSVNTYTCGNYIITSDCEGNVLKQIDNTPNQEQQRFLRIAEYAMVGLVTLLIIFGLIGGFMKMKDNENNDEEIEY